MEIESRTKAALGIIEKGKSFRIDNLLFSVPDSNSIIVTGWTKYIYLNSLTRDIALAELANVRSDFKHLISTSNEWKHFIKDKNIEYNLAFDDYGKAGILICREKDENFVWLI